jgi:polysaccharide export outer membrane protein
MRLTSLKYITGSIVLGLIATVLSAQNLASLSSGSGSASSSSVSAGSTAVSLPASQFLLGPADVIRVNVWKNTDLSQTVTIGPDGFVSLPLLGEVHVAGLSANQLGQTLAAQLSTYVVNPQVTVSVVDIRSRQVYVLGQVGKPGGYPLIAPLNVLQLIAEAGGLSNYANRKGIVILRGAGSNTEKIAFNYNNAIHGDERQNISLKPGDTVVIP